MKNSLPPFNKRPHLSVGNSSTEIVAPPDSGEVNATRELVRDLIPEVAKYLNSQDLGSFSLSKKSFFLDTLRQREKARIPTEELIHTQFFFRFPFLKQVQLVGQIPDEVVEALARKAPNLNCLDLRESELFEEDILTLMAQRFPGLTSLNLSGCDEITDQGLKDIAGFERLTVLDLSNCTDITDQGLAELPRLNFLNVLNLSGCDRITDTGLAHLARLDALVSLDLSGCFDLTDIGLLSLNRLQNLKYLNLTDCEKITPAGVTGLRSGVSVITGN
ncbi:MAG: hypothetical protein LW629_08595 [Burkholderiales bacterium]|nr:hypothetical protein [Burkholderiales bacterium]